MQNKYLEYISKFLGESSPMIPEPTLLEPSFRADPSVKAVIFDIYGTIMISASGDIEESEITTRSLQQSLNSAGILMQGTDAEKQQILLSMLDSFREEIIRTHETERRPDKPYPEVDILKIWESIIIEQHNKKNLKLTGPLCIKCFTFVFEVLSNNVYPMPGMKEVIGSLSGRGIPLGIISNAQFYTPVILNFFLNGRVNGDEYAVPPFDRELTVYSFCYQRSKPDPYLFEIVKNNCVKKYGISPHEVLFLGNDMFRDVYPAHKAGFKTALFAGDRRSLRLRKDKPEMDQLEPDYTVTSLEQLLKIVT